MILDFLIVICLASSIIIFKSMLLKIILIFTFYPLFALTLFKYGVPLYGLLANLTTFSPIEIKYAYYSYVIAEVLFILILLPVRNEIYEYKPIRVSNNTFILLFLCLIISSYPVLLTHVEGYKGIKTATFYAFFNVLLLLSKQCLFSFRTLFHFFYLLIMIMLGERVDSILVIIVLLVMNGNDIKRVEQYKKKLLYLSLICLFALAIFVRANENSLNALLVSVYSQATACDGLYVYLCSVKHYVQYGAEYSVLGNLFFGLFPGVFYGAISEYNYTVFLNNHIAPNVGGGLFFSEGMLAFGPLGVVLYMVLMAVLIKYLFKHKTRLHYTIFLLFMIIISRIIWYGFIYTYKPAILCILFILFFNTSMKHSKLL